MPPLLLSMVLTIAVFAALTFFMPTIALIELTEGLAIVFSVAVAFAYRGLLWVGITSKKPHIYDLLICGIALGWATNALDRLWRLLARITENHWMLDTDYVSAMLGSLAFCAVLHLIARDHNRPERRTVHVSFVTPWLRIGIIGVAGIGLGGLATWFHRSF